MVEISIRARGASSNALGGCGSLKMPKVMGTRAKSFRAFSMPLPRRESDQRTKAQFYPPGCMDRPPSRAREEGAEKYLRHFFGR